MFYPTITYGFPLHYLPKTKVLLPASSWARGQRRDGSLPTVKVSENITEVAADCGGFVASRIWGEYRYSPAQYVDWLERIGPKLSWAATMDYCCEPPLTGGDKRVIIERQTKTHLMAHLFWDEYRHRDWVWVPTIQGWEVSDYIYHAHELAPLIQEMHTFYAARGQSEVFRVGIGTLCARASSSMINQVLTAVRTILPQVQFHLWGVKLGYLKSDYHPTQVASFDSAAWDTFGMKGAGLDARQARDASGLSQHQYAGRFLLPAYQGKVETALKGSRQMSLL